MSKKILLDRRELVIGLAAGTIVPLAGCADNAALGRNQLMLVSQAEIERLSATAWRDTIQRERVLTDPAYTRRLERVGTRMAETSGLSHLDWEFVVIDSDLVNAWVLPNGKVAFYKGLMDLVETDGHVATIMGHEMGHVAGRHAAERASQQRAAQMGMQLVGMALQTQGVDYDADMAAALGAGIQYGVILPYSREHEFEADRLGIDYMVGAGYAARDAMDVWLAMSTMHQERALEFTSTHPSDDARIAAMRAHIEANGYI